MAFCVRDKHTGHLALDTILIEMQNHWENCAAFAPKIGTLERQNKNYFYFI